MGKYDVLVKPSGVMVVLEENEQKTQIYVDSEQKSQWVLVDGAFRKLKDVRLKEVVSSGAGSGAYSTVGMLKKEIQDRLSVEGETEAIKGMIQALNVVSFGKFIIKGGKLVWE